MKYLNISVILLSLLVGLACNTEPVQPDTETLTVGEEIEQYALSNGYNFYSTTEDLATINTTKQRQISRTEFKEGVFSILEKNGFERDNTKKRNADLLGNKDDESCSEEWFWGWDGCVTVVTECDTDNDLDASLQICASCIWDIGGFSDGDLWVIECYSIN